MKIRTKILGGFFIIIVLSLFLGITVFFNTVELSSSFTFLIEHDLEVLQNAQKLQKLVVDAETGQRGFIITGDESFLEPYNDGITGFSTLIQVEKELVSDNPSQVQRLEHIQVLFEEWKLKAAQPEIRAASDYYKLSGIESDTATEFSSVAQLLQSKTGKNILDQIRDEFTIFIQIENDLKDERLSNVLATSIFTETLLILLPISITAVSGIIAFFFTQSISRPLEILKQASAKVGRGNFDTKIKQVSLEKRKTKSVNESSLKSANASKPFGFKNKMLAIFLGLSSIIGIVGVISYIEITQIQDDLTHIFDIENPALLKLNEMKSVVLEGIEEAFAYLLLDAEIEKDEFYEKMNHFDLLSKEFEFIARIGEVDQQIETQLFFEIISNKERLVDSATLMFEAYENTGKINAQHIELFEEEIDTLIPLLDEFIAIEIDEVNADYRHANENINATYLTLPVIILAAILVSIFGGIIVSRSISEPMVIVSSTDEQLQQEDESYISSSGDEIKELSDTFNTMVKGLKEIDEKKESFVAMVSHELKTPLVPIKLYTQMLLKEEILGKINDKQRKALISSQNNIQSLENLVDDVLDASKLDLGRLSLHKQKVDVQDLLNENIESLSSFAKEKKITLESDLRTSGTVFCDPQRISQVLSNLVKNSIDFSPEKIGRIKLIAEKNTDSYVFMVEDNGSGIPKENREFLFQKFYQIDTSPTRKHGGSGLGLTICRGIVESHGGKIWLDEEYAQGARFIFTIPRVKS